MTVCIVFHVCIPFFTDDMTGDKPLERRKDVHGFPGVYNFFAVSAHLLTKKVSPTMMNKTRPHSL